MKKILVSVLALSLLFSQGAFVFAASTKDSKIDVEKLTEIQILPPVKMTLEQAYEKMKKDSPQAISANFIHESELAVAAGYADGLRKLNRADKLNIWADTSEKPIMELRVDFAKSQADKNYEAALNKIKRDVYEKYYNHKQAEAQLLAAKEHYGRALKLKQEADLKFKVGKVSKLETINADTALNEALDAYEKAKNGFEASKMGYNLFMGYNIKQEFSLTDPLEPFELSKMGFYEALSLAKYKRNEIADVKHKLKLAEASLKMVNDYPSGSTTYKKAKVAYDMALLAWKSAPGNIEMDVTNKYATMKQNYDAVNLGKQNLENTKEIARIGQLQFDAGFITATDLKTMNLAVYNAQQAYNKAVLDYNLSVTDYEQCATVGTKEAEI